MEEVKHNRVTRNSNATAFIPPAITPFSAVLASHQSPLAADKHSINPFALLVPPTL